MGQSTASDNDSCEHSEDGRKRSLSGLREFKTLSDGPPGSLSMLNRENGPILAYCIDVVILNQT